MAFCDNIYLLSTFKDRLKMHKDKIEQIDWDKWEFTEDAVLTFIKNRDELLLIHKKRGLGKGKVNAPGGRVEPGETNMQAAIRECQEEVGLTPSGLVEVGELNFIFMDGYSLKGYVFFANKFSGNLIETDEADPFWCKISEIPYNNMWADDIYWLPPVLNGEKINGYFTFNSDTMLSKKIDITGKWSF